METIQYSTELVCARKGRTCRRCFVRALEAAGIDAGRYLKDALSACNAPYQATYRHRYQTDPAYRVATRAKWKVYRATRYSRWNAWQRHQRHLRRAGGDFTNDQWLIMQRLYGYRCAYCHCRPAKLTMDHVIPLAKGGPHT